MKSSHGKAVLTVAGVAGLMAVGLMTAGPLAPGAHAGAGSPISGTASAAVPANFTIVPGKSLGRVWLGATRTTVRGILGTPTQNYLRPDGLPVDEWLGPQIPREGWDGKFRHSFKVLYKGGRAVQLEASSPEFRTREGVSTRTTLGGFRRHYRPTLRTYLHADPEGGGYRAYFYDDVRRGLAFTFGAQDSHDATVLPELLRVHRRGYRAIADPGGVRRNYRDEIPVRR